MTENLTPDVQDQITDFLPKALENAIKSYDTFLTQKEQSNAENAESDDFRKHHDACKVALVHIELILKLVKSAEAEGSVEDKRQAFTNMMRSVQAELNGSDS